MPEKFWLFTHYSSHENRSLSVSVCQQADRHEKLPGGSVLLSVLGDSCLSLSLGEAANFFPNVINSLGVHRRCVLPHKLLLIFHFLTPL